MEIRNGVQTGYNPGLGTEYEVQANRWKQRQQVYGDIDFKSNLFMSGTDGDAVLQRIENHLEGNNWYGNGISGDLLSWDRYITDSDNLDDVVFQSANGGKYTNIHFDQGWYTQMNEQQFAYATGAFPNLSNNQKPYDLILFGQDQAQFIDYSYQGFADGQTRSEIPFSSFDNTRWDKNVSFVQQEYNPFAVDYNPYSTGEHGMANYTYNQMLSHASQWMDYDDKLALSQYDQGTSAWNTMMQHIMMTHFDQGNQLYKWYGDDCGI
ncbi:hypothetical protein J6Q66_02545 [bacterium]|nr:hypothetical protein [bacterium]